MMRYFSQILEAWYQSFGRELPWRNTKDPYRIWISEIILQQTRVSQGYAYYLRFIERFPDVESLASAAEEEVLLYWQGLGYYSRARNLHQAAISIMDMYDGVFPDSYEKVRKLKGVGDYTAAAICSFAFDQPYAVVDGNVYRVLSRLTGLDSPIDSVAGKKEFALLADRFLDCERPALYNQAIMDFGALVCLPRNPHCADCPLAERCIACQQGLVDYLPVKHYKVRSRDRFFNYIYVRAGNYTFLNKRTTKDVWHNLYEFPLIETDVEIGEEVLLAHPELAKWIEEKEEPAFRLVSKGVKHVLSHQIIHANFYAVELPEDTKSFKQFQRIDCRQLVEYPVSRLIELFLEKNELTFG